MKYFLPRNACSIAYLITSFWAVIANITHIYTGQHAGQSKSITLIDPHVYPVGIWLYTRLITLI